jgi:hypothetical protein
MNIKAFFKPFLLFVLLSLLYFSLPTELNVQAQEVCYDQNEQVIPCKPKKPVVRRTNTPIPSPTQTLTSTPLPTHTSTATPLPTLTFTPLPTSTPVMNQESEPEKPTEGEPGEPIGTNDTDNLLETVFNTLRNIQQWLDEMLKRAAGA